MACATYYYSLKYAINKFPDLISVGSLHYRYP